MENIETFLNSTISFSAVITYRVIFERIFLSFAAGFILGLERKFRQQPVGLRTLILICVSSSMLMMLSIHMSSSVWGKQGDPSRIAAQVVSGIGFLGGGAILRQGMNIKGLTSAAIIWTSAALGLAIGGGLYLAALFVLLTSVIALVLLEKFESRFFPAERVKKLFLVFDNNRLNFEMLHDIIKSQGIVITTMDTAKLMSVKQLKITFTVKAPEHVDILLLAEKLKTVGKLEEINFCD